MAHGDKDQKTEKPTPKRKKEARKDGRIAKSPEVVAWASLLVLGVTLKMTVARAGKMCRELLLQSMEVVKRPEAESAQKLLGQGLGVALKAVLPIMLVAVAVGVIGNVAQVGLAATTKQMKPKWERLNP